MAIDSVSSMNPPGALDTTGAGPPARGSVGPPGPRPRRGRRIHLGFAPALVVALLTVAIWELLTATRAVSPFLLPTP
ncbi:MAG: hypothetical protein ACRDHE_16940, partial [Ktedonobacterales bacterium]